jgi:uncharacterized protein (TIGR03083 family)
MITSEGAQRITRAEAPDFAAEEYRRLVALLRQLDADDWSRATDCEEWDVRAMVAHVLGGCESCASVREMVHQVRVGKRVAARRGGAMVDGMNEVQVRERAHLAPAELVARLDEVVPRAVRGRRRTPGFLRGVDIGDEFVGPLPLGWLVDVIYTRDTWLHRVDISRATGRPLDLAAEHDGRIVTDVVGDWADLHEKPFTLDLTGPAGGRFARGEGGPELRLDAVEFCRIVSGREDGEGLLATRVLF